MQMQTNSKSMNLEYNNIGNSLSGQYKATLFIDNSQHHINQMAESCNRGMTLIKVDETPNLIATPFDHPAAIMYMDMIGRDNTYLKATRKLSDRDNLDPISGIQPKHLSLIEDWINHTMNDTPRAMLFDWDRTISVVEGVYVDKNGMSGLREKMRVHGIDVSDLPEITAEDALLYLCGGPDRLAMLRMIMRSCVELGIDIIFLTNNGGCNPESINGLRELMNGLVPPGANYQVICSLLPPYYGDKGKAFREEIPHKSSLICLKMDGGIKRRLRATIKHKKNKKRRSTKSASRKAYK